MTAARALAPARNGDPIRVVIPGEDEAYYLMPESLCVHLFEARAMLRYLRRSIIAERAYGGRALRSKEHDADARALACAITASARFDASDEQAVRS